MARTRRMTGQYTGHNTPGDGTGFTHFTPMHDTDVLTEVETTSGPNAEQSGIADGPVIVTTPVKMPRR